MAKPEKMTEGFLFGKLKKRYKAPEWALFSSVQNSTGHRRSREADAVAMGTWPSRGMEVHGFEIKVSRADWLRELRNAKKSEAIQKYCDRWWVVVSDVSFVNVEGGELPPAWGLMALRGSKLYTVVEAPRLEAVVLDRGFIAAVLRRAHESSQDPDVESRVRGEMEEEYKRMAEDHRSHELNMLKKRNDDLQSQVDRYVDMSRISGVHISDWNYRDISKAVGVVLGGGSRGMLQRLDGAWRAIDAVHCNLKEAMVELEEVIENAKEQDDPQ